MKGYFKKTTTPNVIYNDEPLAEFFGRVRSAMVLWANLLWFTSSPVCHIGNTRSVSVRQEDNLNEKDSILMGLFFHDFLSKKLG